MYIFIILNDITYCILLIDVFVIKGNLFLFFIGGVKMRYPSCYVLVTDLDESTAELHKNHNTHQTTPQQQQQQQHHDQPQQQQQGMYNYILYFFKNF